MARPGDSARSATYGFTLKAQLLGAFIDVLRDRKRWTAVSRELSPEMAELAQSGLLVGTWISGRALAEIQGIVADLFGSEELRVCAFLGTKASAARFLQPVIEATMRLFGVSPEVLFARIETLSAQSTKGITCQYTAINPSSGVLRFGYPGSKNLATSVLDGAAGSLESVFELTQTTGTLSAPKWLTAECNDGELRVSWTAGRR